ncbi:MAG: lipid-binding SYLF domain-containing protein [Oceanibaculum nanhaiense]|uniref:lipid-binding SYLF domain-containing protein n=1 Tax=Oceanibaculum nanhaiense TaxID=1909734 RepID=UPI0025A36AA6|nr:lipid-binding SYLF domain-containing protein [Oceanibaculum nanhaiense]MDM7945923.1 lipid-binding SYLF domain-containing protein [Oceanibaculum nanhaiense]
MRLLKYALSLALGLFLAAPAVSTPAFADDTPQLLVDKSLGSLRAVLSEKGLEPARGYLKQAKGVLIVPDLVKAGFILGGQAGDGVLLTKAADGSWNGPAFYQVIAGSIGLQAGVESREALFLVMSDSGLQKLMQNEMKLGADASVAIGTVGAGVGASSTGNPEADILVYSKSKGLFGGGSIEGGVVKPKPEMNSAYYGGAVTPDAILMKGTRNAAGAAELRKELAQYD